MYDPRIGRWTSQDPIGFAAGDGDLYRYAANEPTKGKDPSGLAFTYEPANSATFGSSPSIKYQTVLTEKWTNSPPRGSWIQVNTVRTTVVTVDGGNVSAKATTRYYLDRQKLVGAQRSINDKLGGPSFAVSLRKSAVLVFSHVVKEQGFTCDNVSNVRGAMIGEAAAAAERRKFDKRFDTGTYEYSYLWEDADKGKGINNLDQAILAAIGKGDQGPLKDFLKGLNIGLATYRGQSLYGDADMDIEADLSGMSK